MLSIFMQCEWKPRNVLENVSAERYRQAYLFTNSLGYSCVPIINRQGISFYNKYDMEDILMGM